MLNKGDNHSAGIIKEDRGVAKKLNDFDLHTLNSSDLSKKSIEGEAKIKTPDIESPQAVLRAYIPNISQQMLGKHYGKLSQLAGFLSPTLSDDLSNYFFKKLNDFSDQISSTQRVLNEAGVKTLEQLSQDTSRSARISQALIEQNKWLATAQGGLSAILGAVGAGVDIPISVLLALKTVYQTGRAYGFELNEKEQDIVQYIFKQLPLEHIAEKQSILLAVRSISTIIKTQDVQQLQHLVGSTNDTEWLQKIVSKIAPQHSTYMPNIANLARLTPIVSAGVGATYSWKLIEDVGKTAQHIFSVARDYLIHHPDENISILDAYNAVLAQTNTQLPLSNSQNSTDEA